MSIATSNRVWTLSAQSGSALIVLLALADRADDDGYCWPGMADIATRARIDKRQAQRVIAKIEDDGELYVDRNYGRGRTSQYIVTTGQEATQIANTLVRRFEMDTTTAIIAAANLIQCQDEIKGDIQGEKVVYTPPFVDEIKGDIQGEKVVQKPWFAGIKGDIQGEKVTSGALKGGLDTTRTIIKHKEGEDILSLSPLVDVSSAQKTPETIWQMALNDLALSLPTPTYETWVRDTSVLSCEDGEFVIGVPHAYARDWLQNRMQPQTQRILSRLLQRSTEVTFAVRPRPTPNGDHP